ncbi:DUF190 domain-containing protein [Sphingomonas sp. HDW15A]|uniref:DUF190 domain-containing protein n=1 Tax=Sphingomonas sp. HDW15A TaxID=2714942 RepID=UPI00140806E3|nr:DUF190 domain-containing protein [Sphingomonas sp. HDW15A]QIK95985.1 DUF190 domain-containing protein [Sphingomonas sp. HDW15A]
MTDRQLPNVHPMKKIEVVVHAGDIKLIEAALRDAGVAGWTIIRDVAGMGHHGFHQARTIFSDETGLVMFVGVAPAQRIRQAALEIETLFRTRAGVLFLSDVEVIRSDYFTGA